MFRHSLSVLGNEGKPMIYPGFFLFLAAMAIPYFLLLWPLGHLKRLPRTKAVLHFLLLNSAIWFIGAYVVQNL